MQLIGTRTRVFHRQPLINVVVVAVAVVVVAVDCCWNLVGRAVEGFVDEGIPAVQLSSL
jgi:hypothetical protein